MINRNRLNQSVRGLLALVCLTFPLATVSAAFSPNAQQLVRANTEFAFNLAREIAEEQPGKNVFISPYSIAVILQITRNGAGGATLLEMDRTLGTTNHSADSLARAYAELAASLKSGLTNSLLEVANAIYFAPNVQLRPSFASRNTAFYAARISPLDFTDPRSTGIINNWVSQNTHGKIPQLFNGPLSGTTGAVLINAVYFKGTWAGRFDPAKTQNRAFHLADGTSRQVPLMEQSGQFLYGEGSNQIIRLPYSDPRLAMYVVLPGAQSSLKGLLEAINSVSWNAAFLTKVSYRQGSIALPRFNLEFDVELVRPLQALGMKSAFGQAADFSAMSETPLFIQRVKHKAMVEVNEEGTVAAGVTAVAAVPTAVRPREEPFHMVVDRPFLFVICDRETGSILFLGIVQDPR